MRAIRGSCALLALAAALIGGCGDKPDFDVDHKQVDNAPARLSGAGPPPGGYERVWQTRVTGEALSAGYHLVGGQVVVGKGSGLDAYDARTGKPSWHYREPGRRLSGLSVTGGVVVATFRKAGVVEIQDRHNVGLDAGSGKLLWENAKDWQLTSDGSVRSSVTGADGDAGGGVVAVKPDEDVERLGIDARSGDERWKVTLSDVADDGCRPKQGSGDAGAGDGDVLGAILRCDEQELAGPGADEVFAAVDARSGDLLWSRRVDTAGGQSRALALTRGQVTLWSATRDSRPELIGRSGRTLFKGGPGSSCDASCELFATGGQVVVAYQQPRRRPEDVLATVDPRSGHANVRRQPAGISRTGRTGSRATAGDRLYSVRSSVTRADGGEFFPMGLSVFDVANGRIADTPLPIPGDFSGALTGTPAPPPLRLVGVAGGRLFTVRPRSQTSTVLASYASRDTTEPTELGGVAPGDWPDPCSLLAGVPRDEHDPPDTANPGDPVRVGDSQLRRIECDRSSASVWVLWVAGTDEQAAALLPGAGRSRVGADAELRSDYPNGPITIRVGRVIVRVSVYGAERDAAARAVVKNLRRR